MLHPIVLRGAAEADAGRLLAWKNDLETRRNSVSSREISPEDHLAWLARMRESSDSRLEIADSNGVSVGVIRFDWNKEHDACDLSFTVAPEHRGKGYGFAMVQQAIRNLRGVRVAAEVKASNVASRRIFERLGFRIAENQGDLLMYVKDLPPRAA